MESIKTDDGRVAMNNATSATSIGRSMFSRINDVFWSSKKGVSTRAQSQQRSQDHAANFPNGTTAAAVNGGADGRTIERVNVFREPAFFVSC
jgi:hypothetical protein